MSKTFKGRVTDEADATEALSFAQRRKSLPEPAGVVAYSKPTRGQVAALRGRVVEINTLSTTRNGDAMVEFVINIAKRYQCSENRKCVAFGTAANTVSCECSLETEVQVDGKWRIWASNTGSKRWALFCRHVHVISTRPGTKLIPRTSKLDLSKIDLIRSIHEP